MGKAIDSVLGVVTMATTAAQAALVPASGDSFTVRNFGQSDAGYLEGIITKAAHSMTLNVKSPLLHDDVEGIQYISAEAPSPRLFPDGISQQVHAQDALSVLGLGTASDVLVAVLQFYYSNLPGAAARLYNPGDVQALIKYIKVLEVAVTTPATAGSWEDTVITTTENLLKANTDYAVLGYISDVAVAAVGLKGIETGNLRIVGPGTTASFDTSEYFIRRSLSTGRPHIPVINAANANALYASACDSAASTAVKVQLILGMLSQNLPS
jgi:hypothetical protein